MGQSQIDSRHELSGVGKLRLEYTVQWDEINVVIFVLRVDRGADNGRKSKSNTI